MKKTLQMTLLKLAVLTTLGVSNQIYAAAGFVAVPDTGFANSAYTNCFSDGKVVPAAGATQAKGNFGSYTMSISEYPTATANNTCWVAKPAAEAILPAGKTGFTQLNPLSNPIPTTTGGTGNIGTLVDRAWRNSTTSMCIIGTRATMINADHDAGTAGTQLFEINDIARGGFSASGTVNVAYAIFASPVNTSSPVYRVGRTFTSVQHRALKYDAPFNKYQNGINYLDLPTKTAFTGAINGEVSGITSTATASTTPATQDAAVNANYVDFTIETIFYEDNPPKQNSVSSLMYIEAPCSADPTIQANAVRLRQTGQENTTQKEIAMPGYAIGTP